MESSYLSAKFPIPLGVAVLRIALILVGFPYFDLLYLFPFAIIGISFRNPPEEK